MKLPWGNRVRGLSTGSVDPRIQALLTVPLPESNTITSASLHFNVGYQVHGDDRGRGFNGHPPYYVEPVYPDEGKDRVDLRTAIEFQSSRVTLFAEIILDALLADGVSYREGPHFLTPGFRWSVTDSWSFLMASKIAISADDPGTTEYVTPEDLYPEWQLGFGVTYSRAGPDVDRDGDGVADFKDRCPKTPEDLDGWEDDDGCPDPDNDADGIPDAFDQAPDAAEDRDGYLDSDGIPDPDNDADGILDLDDRCPDLAEDFDGVADSDGCPETDADGDGIPDEEDQCPEEAESKNGIDDGDGCPETAEMEKPYQLYGVLWPRDEVAPETGSYPELSGLVERLKLDERLLIEIRITSGTGDAGSDDGSLARLRAEYLKGYLVASGVHPSRIRTFGFPFRSDAALTGRDRAVPADARAIGVTPRAWLAPRPRPSRRGTSGAPPRSSPSRPDGSDARTS